MLPHARDGLESDVGEVDEDATIRRARIRLVGEAFEERLRYFTQLEFAEEDLQFRGLYLSLRDMPCDTTVSVGSIREPFGFERQTPTRDMTFLGRALPARIQPGRNVGVGVARMSPDERATWALAIVRDPGREGEARGLGPDDDTWAITGRGTWLPFVGERDEDDDIRELVHVGVALSQRWIGDGTLSYSARPELRLLPRVISTGEFTASREFVAGVEAAWMRDATTVQFEWTQAASQSAAGDASPRGGSVQVSRFVTSGDRRTYQPTRARFFRVKPFRSVLEGGIGAVELKARLSWLDLGSRFGPNERLVDLTTGVNWYATRKMRVMFDAVYGERSDLGEVLAVGVRLQIEF